MPEVAPGLFIGPRQSSLPEGKLRIVNGVPVLSEEMPIYDGVSSWRLSLFAVGQEAGVTADFRLGGIAWVGEFSASVEAQVAGVSAGLNWFPWEHTRCSLRIDICGKLHLTTATVP
jgi:hypothetical protein